MSGAIYRRMGEPTYGLLLSLVGSWWGVFEACSVHPVPKVLCWIVGAVLRNSLAVYYFVCESRSAL